MVKIKSGRSDYQETPPLEWDELMSLSELYAETGGCKITNDDVCEEYEEIARRVIWDIRKSPRPSGNEFLSSVSTDDWSYPSPGKVRGVINVIIGDITGRRKWFRNTREYRMDSGDGEEECIICGAPLKEGKSVDRAMGDECYLKVLQLRAWLCVGTIRLKISTANYGNSTANRKACRRGV